VAASSEVAEFQLHARSGNCIHGAQSPNSGKPST